MKICVNAGHTKVGVGTGADAFINESLETRHIAYELMKQLADTDHIVIPAVIDKSSNNLKEAVDIANNSKCDLFLSIHLNAGGGQGVEAYTWKGQQLNIAKNICENLHAIGYVNRGVKDGSGLYVIKNTNMTAVLVEIGFVDNLTDVGIYRKSGVEKIANAIKKGVL